MVPYIPDAPASNVAVSFDYSLELRDVVTSTLFL